MNSKYLKYKSKYLALKKQLKQLGGTGFRITIDATVKEEVVKDPELATLFGTLLTSALDSESSSAAKLLELYRANPTWLMIGARKPIPREGFMWEGISYTLTVPTVPAVPSVPGVASPDAASRAGLLSAAAPRAGLLSAAAAPAIRFGLHLVTLPEFEAFASSTLAQGYLDLRVMPAATPAAILSRRYRIDSEYTPTTCAGSVIQTNFDTGNASHTICARRKVVELRLMVKPKMTLKSSILSYNELAHLVGLRGIEPLVTSAAPKLTGVATFKTAASAALEAAEAIEYVPKTLREFTDLLDAALPRLMAHPIGGMLRDVAGEQASKTKLYRLCGISGVHGIGGGSAVCFEETYVPVEIPVVTAEGIPRPSLKLLVKADVGDLPGSLDLLVSNEDIRKLSLHGAKLDFGVESHSKRDELIRLRSEADELEPRLQIYRLAYSNASSSEEERQALQKVQEIDDRLRSVIARIRVLLEHNIPATEL